MIELGRFSQDLVLDVKKLAYESNIKNRLLSLKRVRPANNVRNVSFPNMKDGKGKPYHLQTWCTGRLALASTHEINFQHKTETELTAALKHLCHFCF